LLPKTVLIIAALGILMSIFMIFYGGRKPPVAIIPFSPPKISFDHFVAGEGIIESPYKNILIGVPFGELVDNVYVKVGDIVKKGDPLFKLDTQQLIADFTKGREDLAIAQIAAENKGLQFSFYERLKNKSAASEQAITLALYEKKSAQQEVARAKAALDVIKTKLDRSIILAPIDGEVLQLNVRVGQYADINGHEENPNILFGDTQYYHLRVDIDEEDAWRILPNADAKAFVRGNSDIVIPLEYVYTEPYIIPKRSLTGSNIERVDTRVLQLVYSFTKDSYPVYVGQLLDVYVQAQSNEAYA
jgi:biotin carboxyl carrier protein